MNPLLDYTALLPELFLSAAFVMVLIVDLALSERHRVWITPLSAIAALLPLGAAIVLAVSGRHASMINDTYVVDDFALLAKGLVLAFAVLVLILGGVQRWRSEFSLLILASTLGMAMLPSSRDLITFFIAFELSAIPGYALVGWRKRSEHGHEAAFKYFLLGVVATAVMLYGLSFLFGLTGATDFASINAALRSDLSPLNALAVVFVLVGMLFKVAAVPFHFWAPDAYEGAPLPAALFLAVASKAAALVALALAVGVLFPSADELWAPIVWVAAAGTMTVGNLVALRQTDLVRLLAWSSIAQAGFLLMPIAFIDRYGVTWSEATEAMFDYLIFYGPATIAAFAVALIVSRDTGSTKLDAVAGLFRVRPIIGVALAMAVLSLAGIPPLGGWFAKFLLFKVAVSAGSVMAYALAVIAAVNTAISLAYYALVVRRLWQTPPVGNENTERSSDTFGVRLLVVGMPIFVLISGVLPGIVTILGSHSSLGT